MIRGNRFVLAVQKVGNYRKQGKPLLEALEEMPRMKSVKELSYKGKRLEVEVYFQGTQKDLLDAVLATLPEEKPFKDLDRLDGEADIISLRTQFDF